MAKKEDPIFKVAEEARDYVVSGSEAQRLYELRQKQIRDVKTNLLGAEQKGMTVGKIETAKKMLTKGYNMNEICELTGLSRKDFM